jgi:hypothetical protein
MDSINKKKNNNNNNKITIIRNKKVRLYNIMQYLIKLYDITNYFYIKPQY